ncbi:MAG: hypothetical protein ABIQ95_07640 [Bdellovibrionia bacterium]
MKKFFSGFYGRLSAAILGTLILGMAIGARSPDLDLYFARNIPTSLTPERLEKNISSVTRWPQWFFSLAKVTTLDSPTLRLASKQPGEATHLDSSLIEKGSILKLEINSHRFLAKPFELIAEVMEYQPSHTLHLNIINDSSGRLTRLFDRLEWRLDFEAKEGGAMIHAQEMAHTRHWKARFFGRIAERILMNQTFYPDIIKLSGLQHPFAIDDGPKAKGGFGTGSD